MCDSAWTCVLGESSLAWGMGGSYKVIKRSHSPWCLLQTTQNSQINWMEWGRSSRNTIFGSMVYWCSAETSVQWLQSIVVSSNFLRHSQTSESNDCLYKKSSRLPVTSSSSSQSSIVNVTSLNISGVQSRSIYMITATILSQPHRRICQRLSSQWLWRQSESRNTKCGVGWMPMMTG